MLGRLPLHFRLMAREIVPACTTLLKGHAVAKLFQTTLTFPLSAPFIMYGTYFALAPTAPFAFFVKVPLSLLPKGVPCFLQQREQQHFGTCFASEKYPYLEVANVGNALGDFLAFSCLSLSRGAKRSRLWRSMLPSVK